MSISLHVDWKELRTGLTWDVGMWFKVAMHWGKMGEDNDAWQMPTNDPLSVVRTCLWTQWMIHAAGCYTELHLQEEVDKTGENVRLTQYDEIDPFLCEASNVDSCWNWALFSPMVNMSCVEMSWIAICSKVSFIISYYLSVLELRQYSSGQITR